MIPGQGTKIPKAVTKKKKKKSENYQTEENNKKVHQKNKQVGKGNGELVFKEDRISILNDEKFVSFILCIFYHNKQKFKKQFIIKMDTPTNKPGIANSFYKYLQVCRTETSKEQWTKRSPWLTQSARF